MAFTVLVKPYDIVFFVEQDEPILDAALRQGFEFSYGCQIGSCASCSVILVDGQISYHQEPEGLLEEEIARQYILLCSATACSDLVIYTENLTLPWSVEDDEYTYRGIRSKQLSETVWQLYFEPAYEKVIHYQAGQYLLVSVNNHSARPYSIANKPQPNYQIELHVNCSATNQFALNLIEAASQQALVQFTGPQGQSVYRNSLKKSIIFVAGGTGFSHSKAIIEKLFEDEPETKIHLFWGAKTPSDLYLNSLALAWQENQSNFIYTPTVSRSYDDWQGYTHPLPELISRFYGDLSDTYMYASGAPQLVHHIWQNAQKCHLNPACFSSDSLSVIYPNYSKMQFSDGAFIP